MVVDPVGLAVSQGTTSTRGLDIDLAAAIAKGATYLTGGEPAWAWRVGVRVNVGSAQRHTDHDALAVLPVSEPLREPDTAELPLRLLRAEYGLVPFQNGDELTVLRDWCRQIVMGDRTGLAVVTGIGGSGKKQLALDLADRCAPRGGKRAPCPPLIEDE